MKRLILTLAIGLAIQATTSYAQFDPHPEGIDYKEMCVGLPRGKAKHLTKNLTLSPDENGMLTIRMLVDWAQLETFSAGGVFSASYQLGFTPDDSTAGLSATGGTTSC